MGTVITEALALRRTAFGETSQIAEFMTRERGRLSLILKGVHRPRSRMGGGVDLLDHCQIVFFARRGSRSLAPLRERRVLSHHAGLRSREDLLAAGQCVVELLAGVAPEGQRAPALFDAAVACLEALDARPAPERVPWLVLAWQAQVLRMAGFQPVLDRCVACDRRPSGHRVLRCDPARGGIVCSACREPDDASFPLTAAAADLLGRLAEAGPPEPDVPPPELEADVRRFFEQTWSHVLERRPRCRPLPVAGRAAGLLLALAGLLAGCASNPLGDPATALSRVQALQAEGRTGDVAELGGRLASAQEAAMEDRAEAAFAAGEAEFALGRLGAAFERYRWVLENAPWSPHARALEGRLFEIGRRMLFGEEYAGFFDDRGRGVSALETLATHFRTSERADDALKLVGDYFAGPGQEEHAEAALSYLRVADEYPDSEWAERCLWLAGRSRMLMARGPLYDRNDLLRARELLERSLRTHPRGAAAPQARADLEALTDLLAQAELAVADFYARRGVTAGEELRLANAALLYPQTAAGRAAAERLAARGVDLAALRNDPTRQSVDAVKATVPLWERQAESRGAADGAAGRPR